MPRFCAAYGCVNSSCKLNCIDVSFHKFPLKEPKRLRQWIIALKRECFQPSEHSVLCSDHFLDEDFEIITPANKRRILKPDTVPSKFSFSKNRTKRKRLSYQFGSPEGKVLDIERLNYSSSNSNGNGSEEYDFRGSKEIPAFDPEVNMNVDKSSAYQEEFHEEIFHKENEVSESDEESEEEGSDVVSSNVKKPSATVKCLPHKISNRVEAFGRFVTCEMNTLCKNPALYLKTQQSILNILIEAQSELISSEL